MKSQTVQNNKKETYSYIDEFISLCKTMSNIDAHIIAHKIHKQKISNGISKKVTLKGLKKYWTAWQSPNGKIFYHNTQTNETTWTAPLISGWNQQCVKFLTLYKTFTE